MLTTQISKSPTLHRLHWLTYRLPLVEEFATTRERTGFRYGAIVKLEMSSGAGGTGEVAPLPLSSSTALQQTLEPAPALWATLRGRSLGEALEILSEGVETGTFPCPLLCGIEMAVLDTLARRRQWSLAALLAGDESRSTSLGAVPVNCLVGAGDPATCAHLARTAAAAGFTCVKLKVGLQHQAEREVELVAAVREAVGPEIDLRLDANGAWNLEEATAVLTGCQPYGIQYVEQPLPEANLDDMRALRRKVSIPIAADESVSSPASARSIIDKEAADILIIKPQMVGGLCASKKIVVEAGTRGLLTVLTSSIESGIGVAATLQLAASLPHREVAQGLGTLPLLADDLIVEGLPVRAGVLAVPVGPGLGVTLDEKALNRYLV
jgi:L-Ala-D/L-Glu epimerase